MPSLVWSIRIITALCVCNTQKPNIMIPDDKPFPVYSVTKEDLANDIASMTERDYDYVLSKITDAVFKKFVDDTQEMIIEILSQAEYSSVPSENAMEAMGITHVDDED